MQYFKKQTFIFNYQGKEYYGLYTKTFSFKKKYSISFNDEVLIKEFGEKHEIEVSENGVFSSKNRMNVELVLSLLMAIEPVKWNSVYFEQPSPARLKHEEDQRIAASIYHSACD